MTTPFISTPGGADQVIIDYASKNGLNHCKGETENLEEQLYDCTTETFYQFIKSLNIRARSYGCTNVGVIFWVKTEYHQTVQAYNLLDEFGRYKLNMITNHKIQIVSTQSRTAKYDYMIYKWIIDLLSVEWKGMENLTFTNKTTGVVTFRQACVCLRC